MTVLIGLRYGRSKFDPRLEASKASLRSIKAPRDHKVLSAETASADGTDDISPLRELAPAGRLAWRYPPSRGNRLSLFTDGDEAFERAYEAIRSARERVWLETYIYEKDIVGEMARDALAEAAERGCDVILLFDRWGSPLMRRKFVGPIIEAGGTVVGYNPVLPWQKHGRRLASVLHRDHRKILITDEVGFCGGANVSGDYGGPGPDIFFDIMLEIHGPAVQDLSDVFLETLRTASAWSPPLPSRPEPVPDGSAAQVLTLNRRRKQIDLDIVLVQALARAHERCLLMTPYFVPPPWFTDILTATSRRGVDVRILTAGRSDVPLARVAGRHIYTELLESGVRVFEMQKPILHAKSLTIDGHFSVVGSYNIDSFGSKNNLEVGISSTDERLASRLEAEFSKRCADAVEIELESWRHRPVHSRIAETVLFHAFSV